MAGKELLRIADFEWSSVCRYVVYIGRCAGLNEINSTIVNSFPLARDGYEKTIRRKGKTLDAIETNMKLLERFVGKYEDTLDAEEIAVIRSMYRQYVANAETVQGHIDAAEVYKKTSMKSMFEQEEGGENEFPF